MPSVRKTACIAYRGLVPMSPNTTPKAPRVSAPSPAAPACFAVTRGLDGRPAAESGSVAEAEPSVSSPVGVLPVIALTPLAVRSDGAALRPRAPSSTLGAVPALPPVRPVARRRSLAPRSGCALGGSATGLTRPLGPAGDHRRQDHRRGYGDDREDLVPVVGSA